MPCHWSEFPRATQFPVRPTWTKVRVSLGTNFFKQLQSKSMRKEKWLKKCEFICKPLWMCIETISNPNSKACLVLLYFYQMHVHKTKNPAVKCHTWMQKYLLIGRQESKCHHPWITCLQETVPRVMGNWYGFRIRSTQHVCITGSQPAETALMSSLLHGPLEKRIYPLRTHRPN